MEEASSMAHGKKWWFPIAVLAGRTFVSFAMYVVIALPAISVFGFVTWVEQIGATPILVRTFRVLECVVVAVDIVFFLVYLASDLRKFIRETWNEPFS
jgi:hypothetical protein